MQFPDPGSRRVEGRIERVESNRALGALPEDLQPLERAALYGRSGIWYDAITTLADLRRSQPDDLTLALSGDYPLGYRDSNLSGTLSAEG